MTGTDPPPTSATRRRFLAAAATGLAAATAGCGYVPGGGDLAWETSLRAGGLAFGSDRWYRALGNRLVMVENQSGQQYDIDSDEWREVSNAAVSALAPDGSHREVGETDRQAVAAPAVAGGAVFLPVEGGRVTAIDLSTEGTGDDSRDDATATDSEGDAVRWRVDVGAVLGAGPGDGDETSEPVLRGVRRGDALAVAIGGGGITAFDAETGEEAFAVPDLWTGASGDGTPADAMSHIAIDDETVWTLVPEDASAAGDAAIVGYDRTGEQIARRAVAADYEWIVAVDEGVVAGKPGESVVGFDGRLDRRFALDVSAPTSRSTLIVTDEGRLHYSRGRTVTAIDVQGGEIAFERSNVPPDHLAVGAGGTYVAANEGGFNDPTEARVVAIDDGGETWWEAPLPDDVDPEALFAIGDRVVVVDEQRAYGLHATPGERWSPLG